MKLRRIKTDGVIGYDFDKISVIVTVASGDRRSIPRVATDLGPAMNNAEPSQHSALRYGIFFLPLSSNEFNIAGSSV
jgi:hypothetical protein